MLPRIKYMVYRTLFVVMPIITSLMGCGADFGAPGVYITPEPYTMEQVTTAMDSIVDMIEEEGYTGFRRDLEEEFRLDISFTDGPIDCGQASLRDGCNTGGNIQVYAKWSMVECTSLGHEVLHSLVGDTDHEDQDIWRTGGFASLEWRMLDRLCYKPIQDGAVYEW